MTPINESGTDSFVADSTTGIGGGLRVVRLAGRKIRPADANEREIGVTKYAVSNNQEPVTVRLSNAPGTISVQVAGACTEGAMLKRANGGKVAVDGVGSDFGIADGSGENEAVPVFPL